jgi:hypothetical protein
MDRATIRNRSASSTWVRHGDRWLCDLHTEAIPGDPFGRDQRPMQ